MLGGKVSICVRKHVCSSGCNGVEFFLFATRQWKAEVKKEPPVFLSDSGTDRLLWCDFVIWTPTELHVEKIEYDQKFIEDAISKAQNFYFSVFLPSVIPYVIIHDDLPFVEQPYVPIIAEAQRDTTIGIVQIWLVPQKFQLCQKVSWVCVVLQ